MVNSTRLLHGLREKGIAGHARNCPPQQGASAMGTAMQLLAGLPDLPSDDNGDYEPGLPDRDQMDSQSRAIQEHLVACFGHPPYLRSWAPSTAPRVRRRRCSLHRSRRRWPTVHADETTRIMSRPPETVNEHEQLIAYRDGWRVRLTARRFMLLNRELHPWYALMLARQSVAPYDHGEVIPTKRRRIAHAAPILSDDALLERVRERMQRRGGRGRRDITPMEIALSLCQAVERVAKALEKLASRGRLTREHGLYSYKAPSGGEKPKKRGRGRARGRPPIGKAVRP